MAAVLVFSCAGAKSSDAPRSDDGTMRTLAEAAPAASDAAAKPSRAGKIATPIAEAVGKLTQSAASSGSGAPRSPSLFSTPFVKVDDAGRVQTYLHLRSWDPEQRKALGAAGAKIEVVSERLKLVQAWIPYDRVAAIADLDFVERITPPSYATPR